jgi:hypothetical protein
VEELRQERNFNGQEASPREELHQEKISMGREVFTRRTTFVKRGENNFAKGRSKRKENIH